MKQKTDSQRKGKKQNKKLSKHEQSKTNANSGVINDDTWKTKGYFESLEEQKQRFMGLTQDENRALGLFHLRKPRKTPYWQNAATRSPMTTA